VGRSAPQDRRNWRVSFFPGLCVFLAVMAFTLAGDGLRDALDPRLPL
jgi:ABC-type dipeptide/oligopeptide/nickel transport system permease subunit